MVKRRNNRLPNQVYKRRIGPAKLFTNRGPYGNRSLIRGRGGYWGDALKKVKGAIQSAGNELFAPGTFAATGESLGALAGGTLTDNPLGATAGAHAGKWLGNKLAQLVGFGAYKVRANSLMPSVKLSEGQLVPSFADVNIGTRVRHREFISDITLSGSHAGAFVNQTFVINPGNSGTFPWLSTIAQNYDQYEIKGMVFEFVSTASESFTGAIALGQVCLATDYDVTDPAYTSLLEMQNSQYSISSKPSRDMLHPIECDPKQTNNKLLYVRQNVPATTATDIRDYDFGNFQVAYSGIPTGTTGALGQLWVTYDIVFHKPQLSFTSVGGSTGTFFGSPTGIVEESATFGTALNKRAGSSLDLQYGIGTLFPQSSLRFPSASTDVYYLIHYVIYGANGALATRPVVSAGAGCSLVTIWYNDTVQEVRLGASADPKGTFMVTCIMKVDAFEQFPVFYFVEGTLPGTIAQADLIVTVIDHHAVT